MKKDIKKKLDTMNQTEETKEGREEQKKKPPHYKKNSIKRKQKK